MVVSISWRLVRDYIVFDCVSSWSSGGIHAGKEDCDADDNEEISIVHNRGTKRDI